MASSAAQVAKREFVKVLLALAISYALTVTVNRDSRDDQILSVFRRVLLKVHPDKGGKKKDMQHLLAKKEAWDLARQAAPSRRKAGGRPRKSPNGNAETGGALLTDSRLDGGASKDFRIRGSAVMLTYNGVANVAQFGRFVAHVRKSLGNWKAKYYSSHFYHDEQNFAADRTSLEGDLQCRENGCCHSSLR